ncbi:MAG: hypothetical protein P8X88_01045 [Gammaproteobacteria bacterium]
MPIIEDNAIKAINSPVIHAPVNTVATGCPITLPSENFTFKAANQASLL